MGEPWRPSKARSDAESYRRQQAETARAGLELRQQQAEKQEEHFGLTSQLAESRLKLDQGKAIYEQQKEIMERKMEAVALRQSLEFRDGMATINESDPHFEVKMAVLNRVLPYAGQDPALKPYIEAKLKARGSVLEGNQALKAAGINNPDAYAAFDKDGNYLHTDYKRIEQDILRTKLGAVQEAARVTGGVASLAPGGGVGLGKVISQRATVLNLVSEGKITKEDGKKILGNVEGVSVEQLRRNIAGEISAKRMTPEQGKKRLAELEPVIAAQDVDWNSAAAAGEAAKTTLATARASKEAEFDLKKAEARAALLKRYTKEEVDEFIPVTPKKPAAAAAAAAATPRTPAQKVADAAFDAPK